MLRYTTGTIPFLVVKIIRSSGSSLLLQFSDINYRTAYKAILKVTLKTVRKLNIFCYILYLQWLFLEGVKLIQNLKHKTYIIATARRQHSESCLG